MSAHRTPAPRWALSGATALLWAGLFGLPGCGGDDGPGDLFASPISSADSGARGVEATVAAPAKAAGPAAPAASAADALLPHIMQAPQDAMVEAGSVATFSVRADGPRGLSYQWLRDGDPVEGAIGTSLQVVATEAEHLAVFSVDVTAGKHTVRSAVATLRVKAIFLATGLNAELW